MNSLILSKAFFSFFIWNAVSSILWLLTALGSYALHREKHSLMLGWNFTPSCRLGSRSQSCWGRSSWKSHVQGTTHTLLYLCKNMSDLNFRPPVKSERSQMAALFWDQTVHSSLASVLISWPSPHTPVNTGSQVPAKRRVALHSSLPWAEWKPSQLTLLSQNSCLCAP